MAATPNYRGMFLRGYGSQNHTKNNGSHVGNTATNHASAGLNVIQGDAIREVIGILPGMVSNMAASSLTTYNNTELFHWGLPSASNGNYKSGIMQVTPNIASGWNPNIYLSRKTPTANEIRPINMAVRYLIRTRI